MPASGNPPVDRSTYEFAFWSARREQTPSILCSSEVPEMSTKAPNPVDRYVGSRVRMRRIMLGMSQEKLGDALGLTFQQVQKYEKGTNRVGASRIQQISEILQVPVSFLFEGGPSGTT